MGTLHTNVMSADGGKVEEMDRWGFDLEVDLSLPGSSLHPCFLATMT